MFISISKPSNNKLRNDPSENEERFKVRLSGFASSACEEYKFKLINAGAKRERCVLQL